MDNNYLNDENFMSAIPLVFSHEGGFVDNGNDSGGATNLGISLKLLSSLPIADGDVNGDGICDINDIKLMTKQWASFIYYKYFYKNLAAGNPADAIFLKGWINRVNDMGNR